MDTNKITCDVCGEEFPTQDEHDQHHQESHPEESTSTINNDVSGPATPEEESKEEQSNG